MLESTCMLNSSYTRAAVDSSSRVAVFFQSFAELVYLDQTLHTNCDHWFCTMSCRQPETWVPCFVPFSLDRDILHAWLVCRAVLLVTYGETVLSALNYLKQNNSCIGYPNYEWMSQFVESAEQYNFKLQNNQPKAWRRSMPTVWWWWCTVKVQKYKQATNAQDIMCLSTPSLPPMLERG